MSIWEFNSNFGKKFPIMVIDATEVANLREQIFPDSVKQELVEPQPVEPVIEVEPEPITEPLEPVAISPEAAASPNLREYLKEIFGKEDENEIKTEWQQLQELKNKPAQEPLIYNNEQSKKIHEALRAGKTKEVKQYLDAQEMLSNVEQMSDDQKLKLLIKVQNPKFDDELIEYKFNKYYAIDEDNIFDPLELRMAKAEVAQRKDTDLKGAAEYFNQYLQKIELPDITPALPKDEGYESYKQLAAEQQEYRPKWEQSINSVKEENLAFKIPFEDTDNKVSFETSIIPDKTDFQKAKETGMNFSDFLAKNYVDANGKYMGDKFLQDIAFLQNKEKYIASAVRQGYVQGQKKVLRDNKPTSQNGMSRNMQPVQTSEVDSLREQIFGVRRTA